ncbi:M50 family metallopeptidase [Flindersiella endophytica]
MPADFWEQLTASTPKPDDAVIWGTVVVALVVVGYVRTWLLLRTVITIVHEGGHALAALVTGRRLSGIRLHSDTSGLTVSRGKPTGPGMILTSLSGYIAPSLLGLGYAALLAAGRSTLLLWLSIALLAALLLAVRNLYGWVAVIVVGGGLFAIGWYGSPDVECAFAYTLTWFLLFGGIRPVFELQVKRSRRAQTSDADQLARLTRTHPLVWVTFFALVAFGALAVSAWWLVGPMLSWVDFGWAQ